MSNEYDQALAALIAKEPHALETIAKTIKPLQQYEIVDESGKIDNWAQELGPDNSASNKFGFYRASRLLFQTAGFASIISMGACVVQDIRRPPAPAIVQEMQTKKLEEETQYLKLTAANEFLSTKSDPKYRTINIPKYRAILEEKKDGLESYLVLQQNIKALESNPTYQAELKSFEEEQTKRDQPGYNIFLTGIALAIASATSRIIAGRQYNRLSKMRDNYYDAKIILEKIAMAKEEHLQLAYENDDNIGGI